MARPKKKTFLSRSTSSFVHNHDHIDDNVESTSRSPSTTMTTLPNNRFHSMMLRSSSRAYNNANLSNNNKRLINNSSRKRHSSSLSSVSSLTPPITRSKSSRELTATSRIVETITDSHIQVDGLFDQDHDFHDDESTSSFALEQSRPIRTNINRKQTNILNIIFFKFEYCFLRN